ncbi:hypothetical protein WOLCODRAFT_27769 [Wolfiporia cocos MD-104 SS10]|uniref:Mid2 domain-containing protein n=1 Tax=Wolfiporia cocos (strain MD-104) TaxID=742152 RepID=A0A2H3JC92_WOLCO|nr:hypothetical protein WOLCODRAFT_27769 [Wolfiporia cocos MD-104 SS10]
MHFTMLAPFAFLALLPALASAYTFNFTSTPQQCQNLSLDIVGAGKPPYSVLVIPFGASPLPGNKEVRRIFQVNFTGTSTSFQLKYPTDSQFVAVVSDSTGFGTGGTSVAGSVLNSSDSSCYDPTDEVAPEFYFSVYPNNQLVECDTTRIWWNSTEVEGTPTFRGVIPGGQSFSIPQGSLTNVTGEGLGFDWTPSVRIGTTVILVAGDDRGVGTGGSGMYIMSQGSTQSCLNSNSPSSTPGSPAGGSYPTSTSGAGTGGSNSGSNNGSGGSSSSDVGAIVGGVVGGVGGIAVALAVLFLLFMRRNRSKKTQKERSVDLLQEQDRESDEGQLPQYYQPEPFVLPEPTAPSTVSGSDEEAGMRPYSERRESLLVGEGMRPGTPGGSSALTGRSNKSRMPPSLRPVNIVQHEDAGPPMDPGEDLETIELPPAYTNIRHTTPPNEEEET